MVDETGRIAVINEQACSLLELAMSPGRADRPGPERDPAEPARGCSPSPRWRSPACARSPRAASRVRFIFFECADGRRVGFDFVPLADGGRLWTFRDITQFKLMEEEQRGFLATMSHEIKTPLSGIAGAAELLRDAGLPEPRARAGRGHLRRRAVARPGCCATCSTSPAPRPAGSRPRPPTTTRGAC